MTTMTFRTMTTGRYTDDGVEWLCRCDALQQASYISMGDAAARDGRSATRRVMGVSQHELRRAGLRSGTRARAELRDRHSRDFVGWVARVFTSARGTCASPVRCWRHSKRALYPCAWSTPEVNGAVLGGKQLRLELSDA